jgi:hypothetical protein
VTNPFTWFWNLVQSEPASFCAVVRTGLLLGEAFGLHWTPQQMAETQMFVEVLLAFLTRQSSTANINLLPPISADLKQGS